MEIAHLFISPGHNFFGHHGRPAGDHPSIAVEKIECIAGRGIRGDRFFDYKHAYKGQITFFGEEIHRALCQHLGIPAVPVSATRRNVITRGVDLNELIGSEFEVQGVRFLATEECRPCSWMDQAFAPGAEKFLRGRGGLRARILSDGEVRLTSRALAAA